jgi:mRNA interferase RelE/StbE
MGSYEILWKRSAERDLRNLERVQIPRIIKVIEALANNPFPSQCIKLHDTKKIYRLRVGSFRIIYQVDTKTKIILIYYIRHRKDVYRKTY